MPYEFSGVACSRPRNLPPSVTTLNPGAGDLICNFIGLTGRHPSPDTPPPSHSPTLRQQPRNLLAFLAKGFFFVATKRQLEDGRSACLFGDTGFSPHRRAVAHLLVRKATSTLHSPSCRLATPPNREVPTQRACLGSRHGPSLLVLVFRSRPPKVSPP